MIHVIRPPSLSTKLSGAPVLLYLARAGAGSKKFR